ncbi:MAG: hypothetical protein E4H30_03720 [Methanomassiliicoccus sp.]|nr:MAG: hypothetical protein E4H30_03720 [Methanomassiliicoccus sp.]
MNASSNTRLPQKWGKCEVNQMKKWTLGDLGTYKLLDRHDFALLLRDPHLGGIETELKPFSFTIFMNNGVSKTPIGWPFEFRFNYRDCGDNRPDHHTSAYLLNFKMPARFFIDVENCFQEPWILTQAGIISIWADARVYIF